MSRQRYQIIGFYLVKDIDTNKIQKNDSEIIGLVDIDSKNNLIDEDLKLINQLIEEDSLNDLAKLFKINNSNIEYRSEIEEFNVYDLYQIYDQQFFEGLLGPIKLEWSKIVSLRI